MFLDNILGAMIFQIIGASVRWAFYQFVSLFTKNSPPSFIEVYEGTDEDDSHIFSGNALLNGVLGLAFGFGALFLAFLLST